MAMEEISDIVRIRVRFFCDSGGLSTKIDEETVRLCWFLRRVFLGSPHGRRRFF